MESSLRHAAEEVAEPGFEMPFSTMPPSPHDDLGDQGDTFSDYSDDDDCESVEEDCPFSAFFSSPSSTRAPVMHFPHCRLEVCTLDFPSSSANGTTIPGKVERVGLPGSLVRTLIRRFDEHQQRWPLNQRLQQTQKQTNTTNSSATSTTRSASRPFSTENTSSTDHRISPRPASQRQHMILPHFEDNHDWVYTRCLLAEFTGLRENDAMVLSRQGRLCCWASVMLYPLEEEGDGEDGRMGSGDGGGGAAARPAGAQQEDAPRPRLWELRFVVQKVRVRDPSSGWCECFLAE
ncbi:hypothetical protein VTJ49DRAFT_3499 [Mycothermus thermophilus]|uniref:Uncharacterized protein n=1 Tax=Humicola insolens TaxID=85995 RepID=A0ABR3V7E2_HUMIN